MDTSSPTVPWICVQLRVARHSHCSSLRVFTSYNFHIPSFDTVAGAGIYHVSFSKDSKWIKFLGMVSFLCLGPSHRMVTSVWGSFLAELVSLTLSSYAAVVSLIYSGDLQSIGYLWTFKLTAPLAGLGACTL